MKNILFISPTGGYAGIDVSLEMLVCGINKNLYNPIVVFPKKSELKSKLESRGIKCYSLPLHWWFPIDYTGNDLIRNLSQKRLNVESLKHIISDEKIDLVVSNTTVAWDGALAANIMGIPHAFFAHAQFASNIYTNMDENTRENLYRLMGILSDRFICCSEKLCEQMALYMDNASCVLNGVDTEKFPFKKRNEFDFKELKMVCVGHYNSNKNQLFVLEALEVIKREKPDALKYIHFTMIGPGENRYILYLKRMVEEYNLEKNVTFEGFQDNISKCLDKYTLYINSSITENFPISVLEAMSNGLPVLATPNDGTLQIVDNGKTGYICNTPEEMAAKMIFLLQHPEILEIFSEESSCRVRKLFSKNVFINSFQKEINYILAKERIYPDSLKATKLIYEILTNSSRGKCRKLNILVIYPKEAMASYVLAAKIPLDELKLQGLIEYRSLIPVEFSEEDFNWADLIFCIRFYDDNIYRILKNAQANQKPFVWYIDDNYFEIKFEGNHIQHISTENANFRRMFIDSSAVIVNNGELYHAGNYLNCNIYRFPSYQIVEEFPNVTPEEKEIIRFGFMGTLSRDQDFEFVIPAIERALEKYKEKIQVDFIGYIPDALRGKNGVNAFEFIFDYDEFRRFFKTRRWQFALAPLADTAFNRSKTNNKYREYSSFAVPGIYSNIITYNSCVINQENGLLAENNSDSWYQAICLMVDSQELREKMSKCAYRDVSTNYPLKGYTDKLIDVFQDLCTGNAFNEIIGRTDILCFSKNIFDYRSYKISAPPKSFNNLGVIFASEEGLCFGDVLLEIFNTNRDLLASSSMPMEKIIYNQWNYFYFPTVNVIGKQQILSIKLTFKYRENSNHMGVYEDRRFRTLWWRILHHMKINLPGMNILLVNYS